MGKIEIKKKKKMLYVGDLQTSSTDTTPVKVLKNKIKIQACSENNARKQKACPNKFFLNQLFKFWLV